jgi:hypothetical protein
MFDGAHRLFLHQKNEDGEFQSVCPDCLETIAEAAVETDLHVAESIHACDLGTISQQWGAKKFFL